MRAHRRLAAASKMLRHGPAFQPPGFWILTETCAWPSRSLRRVRILLQAGWRICFHSITVFQLAAPAAAKGSSAPLRERRGRAPEKRAKQNQAAACSAWVSMARFGPILAAAPNKYGSTELNTSSVFAPGGPANYTGGGRLMKFARIGRG